MPEMQHAPDGMKSVRAARSFRRHFPKVDRKKCVTGFDPLSLPLETRHCEARGQRAVAIPCMKPPSRPPQIFSRPCELSIPCRKKNHQMAEYYGVIQSITRLRTNVYSLTFRIHDSDEEETAKNEEERQIFETTITLKGEGLDAEMEKELGECVKLFRENAAATDLPESDQHKWRIGALANEIMASLADRGFMEAWYVKEENEG